MDDRRQQPRSTGPDGASSEGLDGGDSEGTAAFDAIGDPVYLLDAEGTIEYANEAMLEFTGYDRPEVAGRDVGDLVPASEDGRLTEGLPAEDGETRTFETQLLTSDGDLALTEVTVSPRAADGGGRDGTVCLFRDIRDRKRRERDLELLKQVLTRVFRHNVRNELMTAMGHADMLVDRGDEEVREHAETILGAADRLLSHSENARLLGRVLDTDDRATVDLAGVVETAVDAVEADYPGASIGAELPDTAEVSAHPNLVDVIEELLRNALVHAPDPTATRVDLWVEEGEDGTTLFVEDESGGLDDAEIEVLRTGGETDLQHTSGVGLWLVRWVVEYSGAEMIVHPTDTGTIMGITFGTTDGRGDEPAYSPVGSPFAPTPEAVREVSVDRFRGDTVIGRVEARTELETVYDRLPQTGGHSVVITGEAGIGKTTLVEQFRDRLLEEDDPPVVASGVCESEVQSPYRPFMEMLDDLPSDREFGEILGDAAAFAASDADEAEARKQALFADVAAEIRAVADERPVVLIVEDMHWADGATVDLFDYLIEELGRWSHPVMLLCTYRRSDVEETHPVLEIADEAAGMGRGTVLELDPFGTDEVASLLEYMLELEDVPGSFVEAVTDHTGGTPLFVNELVKHLVEEHGPFDRPAALPDLEEVDVPETIEAAITERLAALPERVTPTLELGAIVGESISFDVLREASEEPVDALIESVNTLVDRGVWTRSGDGVAFVHGVVRDRTLATIGEETRRRLHGRVADAIETVHDDALEEYADRLGTHYEAVGDHETAFEYYLEAGDVAGDSFAYEDAVDAYERALALARTHDVASDGAVATAYADLAGVFNAVGDLDRASEAVDAGLEVAPTGSEPRCRLLGERIEVRLTGGDYDGAEAAARRQRDLASSLGLRSLEASAIKRLGRVAFRRGDYELARERYEHALEINREVEDRPGQADTLNNLGNVAFRQGAHGRAREYFERSLEIREGIGDRQGQAASLNNLGVIDRLQGEYERAREYFERSLEIEREIGDRHGQAGSFHNLGTVAESIGAHEQAREYFERSLEIEREIGDPHGQAESLHNLGVVARSRGAYERAREYFERSLEIEREIGDRHGQARSLASLGGVALRRGEYERAREYFERSLEIEREIGDRHGRLDSLNRLATVARRAGDRDDAEEVLERAGDLLAEEERPEKRIDHARERAALARERGAHDRADAHVERALEACDAADIPRKRVAVHLEDARIGLAREDLDRAREAIERSHTLLSDTDAPFQEGRATLLDGRIAAASGDPDTAVDHWRAALAAFDDLGTPHHALATLDRLVATARETGDDEQAREWCRQAQALLEEAPDPVVEVHRGWVDRQASALEHSDPHEQS